MKFLDRAQRRLGRFAIDNLTLYMVGGQGIAMILALSMPGYFEGMLLIPQRVLAGEWWRLISFFFTPPISNPIFAIFALYMLYFMGGSLEAHWGAARYNLYVLIGYLATIAGAFAFPYSVAMNQYITGSIFLAFAYLFPDFTIMLFFILPVKVKWIALLTWLYYGFQFITGSWAQRVMVLISIANFLLFFGTSIRLQAQSGHRKVQRQAKAIADRDKPVHVCTICGITDKTDRNMDFRYCTKCDPPVEYCSAHLRAHEHRQGGSTA